MTIVWENPTRLDKTKDCSIQKYLETSSKYCILVQFEARSRERFAFLPNTVTCSRSPRHTTCSLHWESGMHEDTGWALPKGSLNPKITTSCTQIELAMRSTRSTGPRSKIILEPTMRFTELRGNLEQRRGLQNSWPTTFDSATAGYNAWEQGQEADRKLWEAPAQGIIP